LIYHALENSSDYWQEKKRNCVSGSPTSPSTVPLPKIQGLSLVSWPRPLWKPLCCKKAVRKSLEHSQHETKVKLASLVELLKWGLLAALVFKSKNTHQDGKL